MFFEQHFKTGKSDFDTEMFSITVLATKMIFETEVIMIWYLMD